LAGDGKATGGSANSIVITGLDPVIHPKEWPEEDGLPGQARQ
jgi:hypothetical protein